MIEHVWQRVRLNRRVASTFIVTCDEEIQVAATRFGAEVIMTSKAHERGTDRVAEGCRKLIAAGHDFDIAINVQGDEPLLHPRALDLAIDPFFDDASMQCVNLIETLEGKDAIDDYNNVKVVFDQRGFALYFSRLPIPTAPNAVHYKQLGVYAMSKEMMLRYPTMAQTPLEIDESDDMLRLVENGIPVKIALSPYKSIGVDTAAEAELVSQLMIHDDIFSAYNVKSA